MCARSLCYAGYRYSVFWSQRILGQVTCTDTSNVWITALTSQPACNGSRLLLTKHYPGGDGRYHVCVQADPSYDPAELQAIDPSLQCSAGAQSVCGPTTTITCERQLEYIPNSTVISDAHWSKLCALSTRQAVSEIHGGAGLCSAAGSNCTLSLDCCSYNCANGICSNLPFASCCPLGDPCAQDAECCSTQCINGACGGPCVDYNEPCTSSAQCCSEVCESGKCAGYEQGESYDKTTFAQSFSGSGDTKTIVMTGFGFSIPATHTVLGVEVTVWDCTEPNAATQEITVVAGSANPPQAKSGSLDATCPGGTGSPPPKTFGGLYDLWGGLSTNPTDYNGNSLTVKFLGNHAAAGQARLYYCSVTVYHAVSCAP